MAASVSVHIAVLTLLAILHPGVHRPSPAYYVLAYISAGDQPGGPGERIIGSPPQPAPLPRTSTAARSKRPRQLASADPMPAPRITFDSGEVPLDPNAKRQMPDSGGERDAARVSSLDPARAAGGGADGAGGIGGASEGAGAGFSDAHVQYGRNPPPVYPMEARRDNEQGEVLLRVLVAADGSVKRVEVVHSSGFDLLDDSAVDAVRARWRFVPAHREGIGVESWAQVPVQFSLRQASANR